MRHDPLSRLRGRRRGRARPHGSGRGAPPPAHHHDLSTHHRSEHDIDDAQAPDHLTADDRAAVHDVLEQLYATIGNYDDEHHVDALDDSPSDLRAALYRLRDLVAEAVAIIERGGAPGG